MATYKAADARVVATMIPTIVAIPPALVQKESLLDCPGVGVLVVEAPVVVDPAFIDVEGGILVEVLPVLEDEMPLPLPGDGVS